MQRRAVDVLYALCDRDSVKVIVDDLLKFLKNSDYSVREELVRQSNTGLQRYVSMQEDPPRCRNVYESSFVLCPFQGAENRNLG